MDWNITCCTLFLHCALPQIGSFTAMVNALAARPELQPSDTLAARGNLDVVNVVPPRLRVVPRAELPIGRAQNRAASRTVFRVRRASDGASKCIHIHANHQQLKIRTHRVACAPIVSPEFRPEILQQKTAHPLDKLHRFADDCLSHD